MPTHDRLRIGDIVHIMTEEEKIIKFGLPFDSEEGLNGLSWTPSMNSVLGAEVRITNIYRGSDAYSIKRHDEGYYEFSVDFPSLRSHFNTSMLHRESIEVPSIDEVDWAAVAFC